MSLFTCFCSRGFLHLREIGYTHHAGPSIVSKIFIGSGCRKGFYGIVFVKSFGRRHSENFIG